MKGWEESRQRIALFGWVTVRRIDYDKAAKKKTESDSDTKKKPPKPLAGVQVIITENPGAFADGLELKAAQYGAEWRKMTRRPDRTYTAEDGSFYFMDLHLPEDNYTLSASLPGAGYRYNKTDKKVKLTRDEEGNIKASPTNIELSPTSIIGRIIQIINVQDPKTKENEKPQTIQIKKPIAMAEAKVLGSGERAYSNEEGMFLLTGVEPVKTGKKKGTRKSLLIIE